MKNLPRVCYQAKKVSRRLPIWDPPTTVTGIRKFMGAVGYFRHFIKNFSRIARPLDDLTSCENSKLKNHPVTLMPATLEVFETLKKKCMTAPVLAFADLEKPFILETDASGIGFGAVLLQEQEDGKLHPVAYASRALHGSQKNYHSSKLEFLTLKWAIMEQFLEYLMYKPFTMRTDNNPLTYIMTTPNLDAMSHRWVNVLAGFDFKIEYLKGSDNKVANELSHVETKLDWMMPPPRNSLWIVQTLSGRALVTQAQMRTRKHGPKFRCKPPTK